MTFAAEQRAALAALLIERGPEAPTLCAGWSTRDLAVHLLVRETRPDAAAGMFVSPLAGHLQRVSESVAQRNFEDVVQQWVAGPRRVVAWADELINTAEHFVHCEDVRRAQPGWEPQVLSAGGEIALHRALGRLARGLLGKSTGPVVLLPRGLARIVVADKSGVVDDGQRVAHVSGDVGEIVLWAFGRSPANVDVVDPYGLIVRSSV